MKDARCRKYAFRTLAVLILTTALVCLLSACSMLGLRGKVTSVTVESVSGLELADGEYFAVSDEPFSLRAVLNSDAPLKATYSWYVSEDGGEKRLLEGYNDKKMSFTVSAGSAETLVFYAVSDGVESDGFSVKIKYASLKSVYVVGENHSISGGTVTQNLSDPKPVVLLAKWNSNIDPDTAVEVTWYVEDSKGNRTKAGEGTRFTADETAPDGTATTVIAVVRTGDGQELEARVKIVYVSQFLAPDSVEVSVSGENETLNGQYVVFSSGGKFPSLTLSAVSYPLESTDSSAPVTWSLRDADSSTADVLPSADRELTFTPTGGENYVTATIGGVRSLHVAIIAVSESDFNRHKSRFSYTFRWYGGIYNAYISDETDLNAVVGYAVSRKIAGEGSAINWYLAPEEWKTSDGRDVSKVFYSGDKASPGVLDRVISEGDAAGYYSFSFTPEKFMLTAGTVFGSPQKTYPSSYKVTQTDGVVTYHTDGAVRRTEFYIDGVKETALATDSDMLYRIAELGLRPVFDSSAGSVAAKKIYDAARTVLGSIADDGMTEFRKVVAIYEWLIEEVDYDYTLAESTEGALEQLPYNGFYLEGVFSDGRAVCDGKAKAFSLMCAIEGIKAVRITGVAGGDGERTGHAWNKVLLDVDGNGVKEWYVVDTTWGDYAATLGNGAVRETLSYSYLLLSDADIAATHLATSTIDPAAVTDVNVFDVLDFGGTWDLYIDTEEELEAVARFLETQDGKYLCVTVSPALGVKNAMALMLKLISYGFADTPVPVTLGEGVFAVSVG